MIIHFKLVVFDIRLVAMVLKGQETKLIKVDDIINLCHRERQLGVRLLAQGIELGVEVDLEVTGILHVFLLHRFEEM